MIKHYLITAIRSFSRNKSTFAINLIGLTTGLSCTLLIFLWVNDELQMDQFHHEDLYQVMEIQEYSGEVFATRSTPGILAENLQREIAEIEYAVTLTWVTKNTLTVREDQNFKAEGWHVGEEFFNVLDFRLILGDKDEVLADKNSMVLSEALARKLFGSPDEAMGKEVEVQHEKTYLVSGVYEDVPRHSSYQFDYLLSFEDYMDDHDWVLEWGNNGPGTLAKLRSDADERRVSAKISNFIGERDEDSNVTLFLYPFADLYLFGSFENGKQSGGRIEYVRLFSAIAIFILVIACINFMNLSTARATRRAKEVGVKKAIGADRSHLMSQYLGESLFISFLSISISLILVIAIMPVFNDITGKEIVVQFGATLIGGCVVITLLAGLMAGSYPAIYLSHFKPATVLKGDIRMKGGELWARRGLVIFQFTLSIALIISVLTVYKQIEYVQEKNLGYDRSHLVYFFQEGKVNENLDVFLNGLRTIPGVRNASSMSHNLLYRQNNTSGLHWEGKSPDTRILFENVAVNYGMIDMLDIELIEGRTFSKDFGADSSKIIFNERGIEAMGLDYPVVGKNIRLWDEYDLEIIGVVKDFHFQSLHSEVEPLFFLLRPEWTGQVMVRLESSGIQQSLNEIRNYYEIFNPGFVFENYFMDDEYADLYAAEQRVATLSRYFAGFAVLISCLGLLGLAAFTAERKVKEIGIRKVLGASIANIVFLLTKDFSKLVIISVLIAVPISYFLLDAWLTDFAYRIELSVWFFLGAGILALLIAWITVSTQAFKAAKNNPTESLRTE